MTAYDLWGKSWKDLVGGKIVQLMNLMWDFGTLKGIVESWTMWRVSGARPVHSWKSTYTFQLPKDGTNSLLLTRSLTDHIDCQLTHILYIMCIIYYNLNKVWRKGNVKKIKEDTVTILYYIIKTVCLGRPHSSNPCCSRVS